METEKGLFFVYLRERGKAIACLCLFTGIFAGTFLLYHVPWQAAAYPAALCLGLGVLLLLRDYRRECAWETETYDGRALEDGDFLFRRKGCRLPMTPSTFTWRFKLILKKHGLPEYLNVHSLRHTNASLLIANGTDVATVAGLLGHSQPSTTLDIYTHAFDKNKQVASRVLQEGLEI